MRQDQYQRFVDAPLAKRLAAYLKYFNIVRGPWPGGTPVWGKNRIWLEPMPGTNALGRTDLAIHGGWIQGSAGCIDLTGLMPDFAVHFVEY